MIEFVAPTVASLFWLPVAVAVFLLPGWLLARRLRVPLPAVAAFLVSCVVLFNGVLLLSLLRLPLNQATVGAALLLVAGVAWRWRKPAPAADSARSAPVPESSWRWNVWWLPIGLAAVSIVARLFIDPLSGYDNGFRWDYLARLIKVHESLNGYPPISGSDFEFYGWCDGIPPLIPLLNFWIYAVCGSFAPTLISVRVIGETLVLGALVWRYASALWGKSAGAVAVAMLASSALALWSVAMSQETGLLAIGLVAMLYYLEDTAVKRTNGTLVLAAVAAAVGALSREYALAYPVLGVALLVWQRRGRDAIYFGLLATALSAPWYLRNWALTGNPLYPQPLGGLFPGNAVHEEQMLYFRELWGLSTSPYSPSVIPRMLGVLAGAVIVAGTFGALRAGRRGIMILTGIGLTLAVWFFLNLPQSGGGWFYASRVLLPALALLAVFGGCLVALRPTLRRVLLVLVTLLAVDAGRRSWCLPGAPFTSPFSLSFAEWRTGFEFTHDAAIYPLWRALGHDAHGEGIVVDHPAHHTVLTLCGGNAVPLVSPKLAAAFDDHAEFGAIVQRLRAQKLRFITLSLSNPVTMKLVRAHPFWSTLDSAYTPNLRVGALAVFDLTHLQPTAHR